jgi:hypothetical protein
MRILKTVLWWLPAGVLALALLITTAIPAVAADTGTYRIIDYVITMEPQSSGEVRMTYQQEWKVLSGNIPWITVGLANSHYTVESSGEAAAGVSTANSGGFTGVRVDLDKDYRPGETFKVEFVVLQSNLLERLTNEKKWRIDFTPGWYDNAVTDHIQINLVSPVNTEAYSLLNPQPSTNGNTFTWEKSNVPGGGQFDIQVECLDGSFLSSTVPVKSQGPNTWVVVGIIAGILILIYLFIVFAVRRNRQARDADIQTRIAITEKEIATDKEKEKEAEKGFKEYVEDKGIKPNQQGQYYDQSYGGYITPIIWMAVLSHQNRQAQNPVPSTHSCACACVSCACACACACAGGGAAGCSRKTLHECRTCSVLSTDKPATEIREGNL